MKFSKFPLVNYFQLASNSFILIHILIIVIASISCTSSQDALCPEVLSKILKSDPDPCSRVKCQSSILDPKNCPEGTYHQPKSTLCKCCPGCVKYKKMGESCIQGAPLNPRFEECATEICPLIVDSCEPGFECMTFYPANGNPTDICQQPIYQEKCGEQDELFCPVHHPPKDAKVECDYKRFLYKYELYHWDPTCDETGYAPKQCKGNPGSYDGECFCADAKGQRIFGRQWWAEAENQTCACSRRISDMRSSQGGSNIATLHCTPDGNYEPVQCDTESGTCWCVEPKTGKTTGGILPQSQWKQLPCYSVNSTEPEKTDNYLRVCDSEMAGRLGILKEAEIHGTKLLMKQVDCDYDGSFAPLQNDGTRMTCTHKGGGRILDFFKDGNEEDMDCKCARDEVHYKAAGRPFPFAGRCEAQTGNYQSVYDFGAISSCVDRDGFVQGTKDVPSTYICCLMYECSIELQKECIANKYIPCRDLSYRI